MPEWALISSVGTPHKEVTTQEHNCFINDFLVLDACTNFQAQLLFLNVLPCCCSCLRTYLFDIVHFSVVFLGVWLWSE